MSPERRPLASIAGGMRIEYGDLPVDYLFSRVRQHVSTRPCRCSTSSDQRRRRPRMRRIPSHCPIPTREAAGWRGSTNHEPVSCLFHCQSVSNRVTRTAGNRIPLSKARTGPRCRHKSSCLQSNRLGSCFQQRRRDGWPGVADRVSLSDGVLCGVCGRNAYAHTSQQGEKLLIGGRKLRWRWRNARRRHSRRWLGRG